MKFILLIEDDRWLAESYRHMLETYDVHIVTDGQSALDFIDTHPVDLILADIMIEGGTVIDVLHDLASYLDTSSIPVIICSSLAQSIQLEDVTSYGVVEILDKSRLRPAGLRQAVQRALKERVTRG